MPEMPTIYCPSCKSEMKTSFINNTPVTVCVQCGHFLMNINALQEILGVTLKAHVHNKTDATSGTATNCPGCKGAMVSAEVGGTGIAMCTHCNVALSDRGSMVAMAGAVQTGAPYGPLAGAQTALGAQACSGMGAPASSSPGTRPPSGQPSGRSIQGFVFKMDEARNLTQGLAAKPVQDLVVDSAFVLHNTGLLITSFANEGGSKVDSDILAGMISAITNFVQDSFRGFNEGQPLQSIRFKGKEIAFEHGSYLILAFEVSGTMDDDARAKISDELKQIESKNGSVLKCWDGSMSDMQGLIEQLRKMLVPMKA